MPLNLEKLRSWPVEERVHSYEPKDTILYALGVGVGDSPADPLQLQYLYEGADLKALPTMAVVLGPWFPWLRDPETGVNLRKMLHGETGLQIHRELPVAGTVRSLVSIEGVVDRGDKGAAVYFRHEVRSEDKSQLCATVTGCFVMRDGGGCGSTGYEPPVPRKIPEHEPDVVTERRTLPQAGLLYRLTGDRNPLHADPEIAKRAGFERPILHGSCAYGVAGYSLAAALCDGQAHRLRRFDLRFSAPMYPGETLRTEIWRAEDGYLFRCVAAERNVVVLNNGFAQIAP